LTDITKIDSTRVIIEDDLFSARLTIDSLKGRSEAYRRESLLLRNHVNSLLEKLRGLKEEQLKDSLAIQQSKIILNQLKEENKVIRDSLSMLYSRFANLETRRTETTNIAKPRNNIDAAKPIIVGVGHLENDSVFVSKEISLDSVVIGNIFIVPPRGRNENDAFIFKFKPLIEPSQEIGSLEIQFNLSGNFLKFIEVDTANKYHEGIVPGERLTLSFKKPSYWAIYYRYLKEFDPIEVSITAKIYEKFKREESHTEEFLFLLGFKNESEPYFEKFFFPVILILIGSGTTLAGQLMYDKLKTYKERKREKPKIISP
jgi:hypothetical protein